MVVTAVEPGSPISLPTAKKIILVASGKGGVGKTNIVANVALALTQAGQRVLVLDADLGLGNLDVLLGLVPRYTLAHVLRGERTLTDVIIPGPGGIQILPSSSGVPELTALTEGQRRTLFDALDHATGATDVLLIDAGAGIAANVLFFASLAQEMLVVTAPEPTAIADAYALMKVVSRQGLMRHFHLVVNMASRPEDGEEVVRRLRLVANRFLEITLDYLGAIPTDDAVRMAVARQRAVIELFPRAPASRALRQLATRIGRGQPRAPEARPSVGMPVGA
ncbi:MinD/ParA family protein [Nitrospira sp. Kam-Ns4a]